MSLITIVLSLMIPVGAARADTYYVDVNGLGGPSSDDNPGTIDRPFQTIEKARDTIRASGSAGHVVFLRGGTYRLTRPLTFDARDSGAVGAPNVYRNYPGEKPILSGGKVLAGTWTVHSGNIWKLTGVTDVFNSLFVDGVRATRARSPNAGFFYTGTAVEGYPYTKFRYLNDDIDPAWTNIPQIEMHFIREWAATIKRFASIDGVNKVVTIQDKAWDAATAYYGGNRYYVENVFAGLDAEGEWYLDTAGDVLYYYPVGGRNPNTSAMVIPTVGTTSTQGHGYLLDVQGSPDTGMVQYLTFQGLTFSHADWHLASFGFNGYAEQLETFYGSVDFPQNSGLGPGVMLRGVSHIDFIGNTVSHIGGHGLDILGDHVAVRGCTITDVGGAGVKSGFWSNVDIIAKPGATRITSSYNEVSGCTIRDVARVYHNAAGVFTQISDHGLYTHNTFSNMPYMGIMMGQNSLSYAEASGTALAGNEISYNDFQRVQTVLHDGASIYCVGYLDGCLVHHNKVHDSPCADPSHNPSGAGWGIYLDQSTRGVTVRDNWVYRVNRGMHINLPSGINTVTNNVFAGVSYMFLSDVQAFQLLTHKNVFYNLNAQMGPYIGMYLHFNPGKQDYNLWYNALPSYQSTWDSRVAFLLSASGRYGYVDIVQNADGTSSVTRVSGVEFVPQWEPGIAVRLGDKEYPLVSVADASHLVVAHGPATASNVYYRVNLYCDAHSIFQNPLFVNADSNDFRLASGSPALLAQGSGGIGFQQIDMSTVGPEPASHAILASAGTGGGVAPSGETVVSDGTSQTFTFTPNAGYSVTDVLVDGVSVGTVSSYTFSQISDDHSIRVVFGAGVFTLEVAPAANGSVSRKPDQGTYGYGASVTLTAVPNSGYTFAGWSGSLTGTTNPVTLVIDSNKSVTANFTVPAVTSYTLTTSATNGTITRVPDQTGYPAGQTVTLTAMANAGYTFSGWSGDAAGASATTTVVMDRDKSVTASFTVPAFVLTVSAVHGAVTASPSKTAYACGEVVTLQAMPDPNYVFSGWSGAAAGTGATTTVTMDSHKTVAANFALATRDQEPPVLTGCSPAPDAIQAPPNTLILLHLRDDGAGTDAAAVSIRVNDRLVYTGDVDTCRTEYGVCRRLGTQADYTYVYQQTGLFPYSRKVFVAVGARDRAGNVMPGQTYSFATEMYSFGLHRNIVTNQTDLSQGRPATVGDGQGNVWVVWEAGKTGQRNVYATRFVPDDDACGPTVQLSRSTGDHGYPAVALDRAGTWYAVWQEDARGVWDIYLATSVDGATWAAPQRLVDPALPPKQLVNQIRPALAAGRQSDHLVALAWQDSRAGQQDIYVARSTDAFATVTISRVTSDSADQTEPAVACDDQDNLVVLWTDARTGAPHIYGAASNNGPWMNIPVTAGSGRHSQPALAVGRTGSWLHLAWVDDSAGHTDVLYAAILTSSGATARARIRKFIIPEPHTWTPCRWWRRRFPLLSGV